MRLFKDMVYKSSKQIVLGEYMWDCVCVWRASVSDNSVVVYGFYSFGFLVLLLLFIL